MNKVLVLMLVASLAGCSTTKNKDKEKDKPKETPVVTAPAPKQQTAPAPAFQRMSTNFKRNGLKMEWGCLQLNQSCAEPEVIAIEVTGYATTNGASESNRDTAFKLATLRAKAKLRKFVHEEISSSTVSRVISKNVEKANEKFKVDSTTSEEISITDEDANVQGNNNLAKREVNNIVVRTVTETIKSNAAGILRGVYVSDETVVDNNNVAVTIRWDRKLENVNHYLQFRFSN